jgi:hypothetical protein
MAFGTHKICRPAGENRAFDRVPSHEGKCSRVQSDAAQTVLGKTIVLMIADNPQ